MPLLGTVYAMECAMKNALHIRFRLVRRLKIVPRPKPKPAATGKPNNIVLWLGMPPSIVKNSPTSTMSTVHSARRKFIRFNNSLSICEILPRNLLRGHKKS